MKENYITTAFQKTLTQRFPADAGRLRASYDCRLAELRAENADATPKKQHHLEAQIMPGIAAYEVLQTVMPKEEACQLVHGYVEERAWKIRKFIVMMLHIPGLYRLVPVIFADQTPKMFGTEAGFAATEYKTTDGTWRIDMTKCPYHDTCVQYGCPELCPSFCDSDDIAYDGIHPKLQWHRTKTLGRGNDCCDFDLHIIGK